MVHVHKTWCVWDAKKLLPHSVKEIEVSYGNEQEVISRNFSKKKQFQFS